MKIMFSLIIALGLLFSFTGCQETVQSTDQQTVVTLSEDSLTLQPGETFTLSVNIAPTSSNPVEWISTNSAAATVFYGKVTAKNQGETKIIATCGTASDTCIVTVGLNGYQLVWSDEFNDSELNENVWNYEVNGDGGGNNELQYYRAENVSISTEPTSGNSCLTITARKESFNGKTATSGRITSKDKVTFTHGMIEASIYFPYTANGLWPAFWMMGNDISTVNWPYCGEIDIVEMGHADGIRANTQDRFLNGACHWGPYTNGNHPNYARHTSYSYAIQGSFHNIRCYWDDQKISMYIDQDIYPDVEPYFEMNINDTSAENSAGNYFHKPNFILFNLAVGGNFPSIWNIDQITALNNGDVSMYVDYVRIYQLGLENETLYVKP